MSSIVLIRLVCPSILPQVRYALFQIRVTVRRAHVPSAKNTIDLTERIFGRGHDIPAREVRVEVSLRWLQASLPDLVMFFALIEGTFIGCRRARNLITRGHSFRGERRLT